MRAVRAIERIALISGLAMLGGCTGEIQTGGAGASSGGRADQRAAQNDEQGGAAAMGDTDTDSQLPGAGEGGDGDGDELAECNELELGATPLQRLGRTQYVHSVRDLLNVTFDPEQLPEDAKLGAFDGNVVVPVTDWVVEQYVTAAETAARLALPEIETLVSCDRAALGDAACATQLIETFGLRAYRRPLEAEEVTRYEALFEAFADRGYPDALRVVVQTMLQSPNFLYRVELMPSVSTGAGAAIEPLEAYELASRLSFFLLSTTPDDALLEAARSGELMELDTLMQETDRLLDDERFSDTLASFHLQWLELEKLDELARDEDLFPDFTPELSGAMRQETLRFVDYVMRQEGATLETLLTAPYSFPEGPLLSIYDLPDDTVSGDEPIMLEHRAGLLTQPAFLAAHSHYNQTSPVQRGKVVLRNVLCQVLPDPPPNVNTTPPDPSPDATTRERLMQHQTDTSCAGCHVRIDGIGLAFEQFDAIGAFRTMEAGEEIDATGEIFGTASSDGEVDGAMELAQTLASSAEAQHCFTTQWLRFALGRPETDADTCTVERLYEDFSASGGDIRELLRSIVRSDAFRSKLIPEGNTP